MRHPRAFTMIELLAALALASILMLALLEVTAGLGRASDAMAQRETEAVWPAYLRDLLEQDLRQAHDVQVGDDASLQLSGPLGIDPQSLRRTHRPVAVRYELRDSEHMGLLVRVQRDLLDRTNRPDDIFLLAHGVRRWQPVLAAAVPQVDTPQDADAASLQPQRLELTLEFHAPEQPALRMSMEVR